MISIIFIVILLIVIALQHHELKMQRKDWDEKETQFRLLLAKNAISQGDMLSQILNLEARVNKEIK